jgi:hypothetical protein
MERVAALAGSIALFCAAASAAPASRLDLMPLPRSALGPGTGALVLAPDSGVVSNADAAHDAGHGFTAADLAKRGRITGYTLDYVLPNATVPQARHALLGVQTIAEIYRDRAMASAGLAFWRRVTRTLSGRYPNGVTLAVSALRGRVGDGGFVFELAYLRTGQPLFYVGDAVFRSGRLLGAVFVSATDGIGLRTRTLHLANTLAKRIRRVLAGEIHTARRRPAGPAVRDLRTQPPPPITAVLACRSGASVVSAVPGMRGGGSFADVRGAQPHRSPGA